MLPRTSAATMRRARPPGVRPGSGHGGSRNTRNHCREASGGHPSLDWCQRLSAEVQRLQGDHAARLPESANFQLGGPEKLTSAHDPQHALQKNGGSADQWYMDDGDIMCHPILVLPFLQDFDGANARVGAERNPMKTEVIYYVNDLDAAPPEWNIGDVRSLAKTSAVTDGSITLGVAVGSRQFVKDQILSKADVIRAMRERVQLLPRPADRVRKDSGESGSQPHQAHRADSRPHNPGRTQRCSGLRRDWAAVSRTALPGSHGGQHDTSNPQRRPVPTWYQKSAGHRCSCTPWGTHRSQTAHPGYDPRRSLGRPSP